MPFDFSSINPIVLGVLVAWSLIWKGFALWKAARASQKIWFIFFLVVNTAGVLEILYIVLFHRKAKILVKKGRK